MDAPQTTDTIAAIATAAGGGIGIVRISGPDAAKLVARVVRPWPKQPQSHKLHLAIAHHPTTDERIDEVLACVMRAPNSYTGEEVAELQGHGGELILRSLLDAVLAAGARIAEPGEFTKRAFLAGQIDLTRAEAVADLIGARSNRALKAAQALHAGALGREVDRLRKRLVALLAELNGAIDFPDENLATITNSEITLEISQLRDEFVLYAGNKSESTRETPEISLIGRTNAGKSSLFNRLCGEERALVDAAPGTTRDVVSAELSIDGVALRILDTAGEREVASSDSVEHRGIELGRKRSAHAQLTILVVDGEAGFSALDYSLWNSLEDRARCLVWNKSDCARPSADLPSVAIATSAATGEGVSELRAAIKSALSDDESSLSFVSRRHREALLAGAEKLERARATIAVDGPWEIAAVEARSALGDLGLITGETFDTDLLDAIFGRFCIGK